MAESLSLLDALNLRWQMVKKRSKAEQAIFRVVVEDVLATVWRDTGFEQLQALKEQIYRERIKQ